MAEREAIAWTLAGMGWLVWLSAFFHMRWAQRERDAARDELARRTPLSRAWYEWRRPGFTADELPAQVDAVARLRAAEPRRESDP